MVTQKQRSETTRGLLMQAMRESLLNQGLEASTTASLLDQTGLSKGALYHHFRSKNEIIEALYEVESRGAIERAVAAVDQSAPPLVRLREACIAWLSEAQNREVSKILFVIGPAALGMARTKQIEDQYSLGLFEGLLTEAHQRGDVVLEQPALTARLLNALMAETALASRASGGVDLDAVRRLIDAVVGAMAEAVSR